MDTKTEQGLPLELRQEAEGPRYYLAGEGNHAGALLEMQLDDGAWQGDDRDTRTAYGIASANKNAVPISAKSGKVVY